MKTSKGFSLIELLVVMAIVGVLACFAYPVYHQHIVKVKRLDGENALLHVASHLESYYLTHHTYETSLENLGLSSTSPQGFYQITFSGTQSTYTITAKPLSEEDKTLSLNKYVGDGLCAIPK